MEGANLSAWGQRNIMHKIFVSLLFGLLAVSLILMFSYIITMGILATINHPAFGLPVVSALCVICAWTIHAHYDRWIGK